jgi:hypothetical protein
VGGRPAVWLLALALIAFIPTAIWAASISDFTIMGDELGYLKQAVHIAHTGWFVGSGDFYFNSYAQLLPLLTAPLAGTLPSPTAVAAAHVLYAAAIVSTVAPTYLLARRASLSEPLACVAAALGALTPWLAFSGTVMTETLAYPLFLWGVLAMHNAIVRGGVRADLIALAVIGLATFCRTQFAILLPTLVVAIVVYEAVMRRSVHGILTALRREHLGLLVVFAALAVALAVVLSRSSLFSVLGHYSDVFHEGRSLGVALRSSAGQLFYIAATTGVVPFVFGAAWGARVLGTSRISGQVALAALAMVAAVALTIEAGLVPVPGVTGRYLFYLAPLFFIGFVALLAEPPMPWISPTLVAVVVGALVASLHRGDLGASVDAPLVGSARPSSAEAGKLLGLGSIDPRPLISAGVLVVVGAAVLLVRRWPAAARGVIFGAVALFGAGLTAYRMHGLSSQADGNRAGGSPRDWIDRSLVKDARVAIVLGQVGSEVHSRLVWWNTAFWNRTVRAEYFLSDGPAYEQAFAQGGVTLAIADGHISGLGRYDYLAIAADERRFGLRGRQLDSRGGVKVVRVSGAVPLRWALVGVDASGHPTSPHPALRLYGQRGSTVSATIWLTEAGVQRRTPHGPVRLGGNGGTLPLAIPRGGAVDRILVPGTA